MVATRQHSVTTTPATSRRMAAQRVKDTQPELRLRQELHRRGLRYRVHRRPIARVRRNLDIVFGPARVAVEVRGCFWHQCPEHATSPKRNGDWWAAKLQRNRERDLETERLLNEAGWQLVVVWEHEDQVAAARRVMDALAARTPNGARRLKVVT